LAFTKKFCPKHHTTTLSNNRVSKFTVINNLLGGDIPLMPRQALMNPQQVVVNSFSQ
jgi:hypothetical protein